MPSLGFLQTQFWVTFLDFVRGFSSLEKYAEGDSNIDQNEPSLIHYLSYPGLTCLESLTSILLVDFLYIQTTISYIFEHCLKSNIPS
jgi:hypothetical protein